MAMLTLTTMTKSSRKLRKSHVNQNLWLIYALNAPFICVIFSWYAMKLCSVPSIWSSVHRYRDFWRPWLWMAWTLRHCTSISPTTDGSISLFRPSPHSCFKTRWRIISIGKYSGLERASGCDLTWNFSTTISCVPCERAGFVARSSHKIRSVCATMLSGDRKLKKLRQAEGWTNVYFQTGFCTSSRTCVSVSSWT